MNLNWKRLRPGKSPDYEYWTESQLTDGVKIVLAYDAKPVENDHRIYIIFKMDGFDLDLIFYIDKNELINNFMNMLQSDGVTLYEFNLEQFQKQLDDMKRGHFTIER